MPTIPSITATCPNCEAVLELKGFDPDIEEPITCGSCDLELDWELDEDATPPVLTLIEPDDEDDEDMDLDGEGEEEEDE